MNARPQFSPDGQWWWNGEAWVPVVQRQNKQLTGPKVMWAVVGGLVIFAVLALWIVGMVHEQQKQEQRHEEFNRLMCQQYGECG